MIFVLMDFAIDFIRLITFLYNPKIIVLFLYHLSYLYHFLKQAGYWPFLYYKGNTYVVFSFKRGERQFSLAGLGTVRKYFVKHYPDRAPNGDTLLNISWKAMWCLPRMKTCSL